MSAPAPVPPEHDVLPPEPAGALSVPPPVPQKKPGFLRRLFSSRKKQQAVAMQNGYLEMVDLIRAIRSHLDRQESVQTRVLTMLEKVPGAMDRQHEVMTMFQQQLENGMENNRRLTDSMGNLNHTLASMDESQKASARTITDLIHRSRESEQLLREVMRRAERRMTILLALFVLIVVGMGLYFARGAGRPAAGPAPEPAPAATEAARPPAPAAAPAEPAEFSAPATPAEKPDAAEPAAPPAKKQKPKIRRPAKPAAAPAAEEPALGQPDLTLDVLRPPAAGAAPADGQPVSIP